MFSLPWAPFFSKPHAEWHYRLLANASLCRTGYREESLSAQPKPSPDRFARFSLLKYEIVKREKGKAATS